jgi:hypothetical protein
MQGTPTKPVHMPGSMDNDLVLLDPEVRDAGQASRVISIILVEGRDHFLQV